MDDLTEISIEIREAQIDDLPDVFHLGERVFTPQASANLYRTWNEFEVTGLFNREPHHALVAESSDGRIAGFALGTTIEKSRSAWNYGHLLWLGVEPNFTRRGIAGMLVDHFRGIMESEGVRMLLIDTQADNAPAIRFFEQKGFSNPVEHVYMTLNLQRNES